MDAVGRAATGMFATDRSHGTEVGALNGRHHDQADAGLHCRRSHDRAVDVELGGIQMAVRVDQHRLLQLVDPGLLYRFELLFAAVALVFLEAG